MMTPPDDSPPTDTPAEPADPLFHEEVERLHRLTVYARWITVGILWLTIGAASLWGLRYPISLILEYFTWAAVKYGMAFTPVPTIGLTFCIGMTVGVLVWQSRNILFGLPGRDRARLEKQVLRIRQQGSSHPLWKHVCGKS